MPTWSPCGPAASKHGRPISSSARTTSPCSAGPLTSPLKISDEQRAAGARAEVLTDDLVRPAYAVLDDAGATALLRGLDNMAAAFGVSTV